MEATTLEDLERLASRAATNGYHFNMSRTKDRRGRWEARFNPHNPEDHEGNWPFGKSNDAETAIRQAIRSLPQHVREAITGQEEAPEVTNHPQDPT